MARLLVRLKVRLLVNALAQSTTQAIGLVLSMLFGLVLAAIAFTSLAVGRDATAWGDRLVVVFAAVWVGWTLLPMLTFSSDETLDPRRFALLPVRPRRLVPGLFAAGLVGVGPVATALGASGAIVGASRLGVSPWAVPVAVVGVAALLAGCVATSRAVTTAASNLLASRRGRDLAALGAALLGVGVYLGFQAFTQGLGSGMTVDLATVAEVARWTPGGMAGAAVSAAASADLAVALVWLAGLAAWIVGALAVWGWAMDRTTRRQPTSSPSRRARTGRTSLYPVLLAWLPRNRTTAVAVRFLRGLARDNRVRTQALQQVFFLVPAVVVSITGGALTRPTAPLLAAMVAVPVGIIAVNQLGLDGPALWQHELVGEAPAADLLGRDLALAAVAVPLSGIVAVGLAAVGGGWLYVPVAVVVATATLAVLLGVANVGAVLLPIPVPEASTNLFGSTGSGQGCVNGLLGAVVLSVMGILAVPILLAMLLLDGVAARAIGAVVALLYGSVVLWGGTRLAAERMRGRGPELLAAVDPGRS